MEIMMILAAVIPAVFLLIQIYRADRLEKEPIKLLLTLAGAGVVSTFAAMVIEQVGESVLSSFVPEGTVLYAAIMYFIIVAVGEEGSKYFALKLASWNSPHFDCQFDGVVYAVFVSLGFALFENILYVFQYGFSVAVARALTAVPGHACFGVFMGAWYGIAKRCSLHGDEARSTRARWIGVLLSALLHGAYDFIASMNNELLVLLFIDFVIKMFAGSLLLVRRLAETDRYITPPPIFPTWFYPGGRHNGQGMR